MADNPDAWKVACPVCCPLDPKPDSPGSVGVGCDWSDRTQFQPAVNPEACHYKRVELAAMIGESAPRDPPSEGAERIEIAAPMDANICPCSEDAIDSAVLADPDLF